MSGGELDQRVKVRRRGRFTVVPDAIYSYHNLSIAARHVVGWILGRSEEYVLVVRVILKTHCLTPRQWRTVRGELIREGFWQSRRRSAENGRIFWVHEVSDDPLYTQNTYDKTRCRFATDGGATDGETTHILKEVDFEEVDFNEKHPDQASPGQVRARTRAGEYGKRCELVNRLVEQLPQGEQKVARAALEKARDPVALAKYFLKNGVDMRRLSDLARPGEDWAGVAARVRAARRQQAQEPAAQAPRGAKRGAKRSAAADAARGKFLAALANLG